MKEAAKAISFAIGLDVTESRKLIKSAANNSQSKTIRFRGQC
jgi:hypothetical protein